MSTHRFGTIERVAFDIDVEPDEQLRGAAFLGLWIDGIRLGATDRTEEVGTFLESLGRFLDTLPPAPAELAELSTGAAFDAVHALATDPDRGGPGFQWERWSHYQRLLFLPGHGAPFDGEWVVWLREPGRDHGFLEPASGPRSLPARSATVDGTASRYPGFRRRMRHCCLSAAASKRLSGCRRRSSSR